MFQFIFILLFYYLQPKRAEWMKLCCVLCSCLHINTCIFHWRKKLINSTYSVFIDLHDLPTFPCGEWHFPWHSKEVTTFPLYYYRIRLLSIFFFNNNLLSVNFGNFTVKWCVIWVRWLVNQYRCSILKNFMY